jgi:hypothetical protein
MIMENNKNIIDKRIGLEWDGVSNELIHEYATFCILCDRENQKLINFTDYLILREPKNECIKND